MRASGVLVRLTASALLTGCALTACATVPDEAPLPDPAPAPRWVPPVDLPPRAAEPGQWIAGLVDPAWVDEISAATGIPERQLASYAGAMLTKHDQLPGCVFSWPTLAAIGAVESDHGRHGGASVGRTGDVSPPIYGVALDGGDTADIPDSDGGTLDGDAEHDRAVGPFQLIPQTWRNWHTDGNGDGVEDPQNFDDAAMAATNYLCRASSPHDTEEGWRAAIAAYNSAPAYLDAVARRAAEYAAAVEPG